MTPDKLAALHLRVIDVSGETTKLCSIAEFVKDNEHDPEALIVLADALRAHDTQMTRRSVRGTEAHAWRNAEGFIIEDGPLPPREPSPDDYVCAACGSDKVQTLAWTDANTGEPNGDETGGGDSDNRCGACESHPAFVLRKDWKGGDDDDDNAE